MGPRRAFLQELVHNVGHVEALAALDGRIVSEGLQLGAHQLAEVVLALLFSCPGLLAGRLLKGFSESFDRDRQGDHRTARHEQVDTDQDADGPHT